MIGWPNKILGGALVMLFNAYDDLQLCLKHHLNACWLKMKVAQKPARRAYWSLTNYPVLKERSTHAVCC